MAKQNRKSLFQALKRFFGMKAEQANRAMDNMVDVETQLQDKIRELREKRETIRGGGKLAQALGLADQLEKELANKRRKFDQANFVNTIKTLKAQNNLEQAKLVLMDMKKAEAEIERVKQAYVDAKLAKEKIEKDLEMLDVNIARATSDLEELRQRNRMAEQTEEIYDVLNEVANIDLGYDSQGLQGAVAERERAAAGKRVLHDNANVINNARYDAQMASLDDELANF